MDHATEPLGASSGSSRAATDHVSFEEAASTLLLSIADGVRAADAALDAQAIDPLRAFEGTVPPLLTSDLHGEMSTPPAVFATGIDTAP